MSEYVFFEQECAKKIGFRPVKRFNSLTSFFLTYFLLKIYRISFPVLYFTPSASEQIILQEFDKFLLGYSTEQITNPGNFLSNWDSISDFNACTKKVCKHDVLKRCLGRLPCLKASLACTRNDLNQNIFFKDWKTRQNL